MKKGATKKINIYLELYLLEKKANDIKNGVFKGIEADDFLKNLNERGL